MESAPLNRRPVSPIPWGLLGMLALLGVVECAVARLPRDFASTGVWDWSQSRRRADRSIRDCRLLCFGDSQVKLGLVPRLVEARAGMRTYNLALIGGQAPSSYFLLRRALAAGARPSAVVVDFLPPLLAKDRVTNMRLWPELLSFRDTLELAFVDGDPTLAATLVLSRLVPSVRSRVDLRSQVVAAIGGARPPSSAEGFHRRNWDVNRGAMILPHYPFKEDPDLWYRVNYPKDWACEPVNARYVDRFLALAEERRITVYWLIPPIDPQAQALCESKGQDARFLAFVREHQGRHRNLVVVDARHAGYPRSAFVDAVHLHSEAALALSEAVAEVVSAGPSAPNWRSLPAYRPRPLDVPLEDLEQSRMAFERSGALRR